VNFELVFIGKVHVVDFVEELVVSALLEVVDFGGLDVVLVVEVCREDCVLAVGLVLLVLDDLGGILTFDNIVEDFEGGYCQVNCA
jgi:hypothetical protein